MNRAKKIHRTIELLTELKFMLDHYDEIFIPIENIRFDMGTWAHGEKKHSCMTAACALGAAAMYPPFKKLGLKLKKTASAQHIPVYGDRSGPGAAELFFGIAQKEAIRLFIPRHYRKLCPSITPLDVSKRVAQLIKRYKKIGRAYAK